MSQPNARIVALENLVAKYEKSLADFTAINAELRTLAGSQRLAEVLQLNENTIASTARLLECARLRLNKERMLSGTTPPFAGTVYLSTDTAQHAPA